MFGPTSFSNSEQDLSCVIAKYYDSLPNVPQVEQDLVNRLKIDIEKLSGRISTNAEASNPMESVFQMCIRLSINRFSTEEKIRHEASLAWGAQGVWQNRRVALTADDLKDPIVRQRVEKLAQEGDKNAKLLLDMYKLTQVADSALNFLNIFGNNNSK